MDLPGMILPPDAFMGVPAFVRGITFGDVLPLGPWALLSIGFAIALFLVLLAARGATRASEVRQMFDAKPPAQAPASERPLSRAA